MLLLAPSEVIYSPAASSIAKCLGFNLHQPEIIPSQICRQLLLHLSVICCLHRLAFVVPPLFLAVVPLTHTDLSGHWPLWTALLGSCWISLTYTGWVTLLGLGVDDVAPLAPSDMALPLNDG